MNRNLSDRKYFVIAIFAIVCIIYLIRLFYLQVFDESYILSAENNVLRPTIIYPNRGLIYDRQGELLVYDEAAYDLMVIPRQVKDMDIAEFCRLLNISDSTYGVIMKRATKYSRYKASTFLAQISKEDYGYLEEKLYKFPGFFVQSRSLRKYPYPIAAHMLGYIGEVNNKEIDIDPYYRSGDYRRKSGINGWYGKYSRGEKAKLHI